MYNELIKNLRETSIDFGELDHVSVMMIEAANAIEELQAVVDGLTAQTNMVFEKAEGRTVIKFEPKWIPVTVRLPEEDGKYLTVHTLNSIPPKPWIEVCWFAKNLKKVDKYDFPKKKSGFYQSDSEYGFYEVSGITHWMPLPEPPKDGES